MVVNISPDRSVRHQGAATFLTFNYAWDIFGMITGQHFKQMKPYAAFINTARGAVVRENEMIEVLKVRSDIQAVIDTTWPEPSSPDSLLYTLPNVTLTPHIAGLMDNECRRMGQIMVDELSRYLSNKPLQWEITREKASRFA